MSARRLRVDAPDVDARSPRGAVLFDFGGTLDADGVRWAVRFHSVYARGGGRLPIGAFDPLFSLSDRRLETHSGIHRLGLRAMIEAQATILSTLLPDGSAMDVHDMTDQIYGDALSVTARNRPILSALRKRYRLAVVSNFTGNLAPCLQELGLAELFDVITDSGVIGSAKPDPLPFTTTLGALDILPADAWMVGDNFEADIRPAQGLGLRTAWLAPVDRPLPEGMLPTARIGMLTELPKVLEATTDVACAERATCTA